MEGSVLLGLDGEPALTVYRRELGRLGLLAEGEPVEPALAKYELGAKTPFGEGLKIRAPLGLRDGGGIHLAGSLSKREVVRVVAADADQMIAAARAVTEKVMAQTKGGRGRMVIDCSARWALLGERYAEEVTAFRGGSDEPVFGFASYGEIAGFGGSTHGFHNTTSVVVGW
jgi:hypothetical protein